MSASQRVRSLRRDSDSEKVQRVQVKSESTETVNRVRQTRKSDSKRRQLPQGPACGILLSKAGVPTASPAIEF